MRSHVTLEKHIVSQIMQALRTRPGVVVRNRHGTAMGIAGDPDLYGSIRGRHFEIEVKRPDGSSKLTELQSQRLREWKKAGAIVGVARCVEDVMNTFGLDLPTARP